MEQSLSLRNLLKQLDEQKKSIHDQLEYGIIDSVDATKEMNMIKSKESKLKKQLVTEAHVTNKGEPRIIKYQESKNLWLTILPNGKRITAITEDSLYDKLFDWYGLSVKGVTISCLFKDALDEKRRTENVAQKTIERSTYSYSRFITDAFGKRDIRTITNTDLKAYTQDLVHRMQLNKKDFLRYKELLNLIFEYALEHSIITSNPVESIINKKYLKDCDTTKPEPEDKIFSEKEIALIVDTVKYRMSLKRYNGYFINGYAILLSIETGMRVAELCALKWEDISDKFIHIHAQQLNEKTPTGKVYVYKPWTKDEKGISRNGRKFPITPSIRVLLDELRDLQQNLGIHSEFVFCHEDGDWIKSEAYQTCLRRLLQHLGYQITNNHAFRMSLNSNILIGKYDLPPSKRAKLLGHSIETNEKHYSFCCKDEDLNDLYDLMNQSNFKEVTPRSHLNVINFENKKNPESATLKGFR